MQEKSVREMSRVERFRHSLEARMFNSIARYTIILGLVCFLIGLGMYMDVLMQSSVSEASEAAGVALMAAKGRADVVTLIHQVMRVYNERADDPVDDEYYEAFSDINENVAYQHMRDTLCSQRTDVMADFFLATADQERGRLVFVADTDPRPEHVYPMGRQLKVPKFILRYVVSEKRTEFPRFYYFKPGGGVRCVSGAYVVKGDPGAGFLFVTTKPAIAFHGIRSFILRFIAAIIGAIVVVGFLLSKRVKRSVVKPINEIAEAAQRYAEDKKDGKSFTDHFAMLNIQTGDEIENLSLIMADMERDIDNYVESLTSVTEEKARIGTELNMAAQIQAAMLPHIFPPYPERPEFDLYATMEPAKEVGGDFYDFFLIDEDHLALVMADVSGKGVPASLFMMASKCILQSCAMLGLSAADILIKTNEALCSNNQMDMFVTCWLGILEISTGKLTAVNAGHEYPAVMEPDGHFTLLKDKHGFALGGFDDESYTSYELHLSPGSRIFVYTDGVPEAMDAERNQFGLARMLEALNQDPAADPEQLLASVRSAVSSFVRGAEQFDDITMLCMEYKGGSAQLS